MTDEELKARLLAEAEKAIEQVVEGRPTAQMMTLHVIEGLVCIVPEKVEWQESQ